MTPEQRVLRARMGAFALHAKRSTRETTEAARAAFAAKFEVQVDPDGVLPEAERQRRATAARRAYMTGLRLKQAKSS